MPSFTDQVDGYLVYVDTEEAPYISSQTSTIAGHSVSTSKIVCSGGYELNTSNLTDFSRTNIKYPYTFSWKSFRYYYSSASNVQNILTSVYGSNSSSAYADLTNTRTNLTLLCSFTNATIGAFTDVSISITDVFQYIHLFHENTVNGVIVIYIL